MSAAYVIECLEAVYGRFGPSDSVSVEELRSAEARLGVVLPDIVREVWQRAGRCPYLFREPEGFVRWDQLHVDGGWLVLYEGSQGESHGVSLRALAQPDPPVDAGDPGPGGRAYRPEFTSFSQCVCAQGIWHAVMGGLPYVSNLENAARAEHVRRHLGEPWFSAKNLNAWRVHGGVVVRALSIVGIASRTEDGFESASREVGIGIDEWDYASGRDE